MGDRTVVINTPSIRLDQFLKWAGVASTGGRAKEMIAAGRVKVNATVERRRTVDLRPGDVVEVHLGSGEHQVMRVSAQP